MKTSLPAATGTRDRTADLRRRPLLACIAAALGLCSLAATATTIPVGRCGDTAGKGGYTLRIAVNHAVDGDVIDLSALPLSCSTITLTGGEIPITPASLTIQGPAGRTVTVNGNNVGRVFYHSGGGVLTLSGFEVAYGHTVGNGGCIYSNGTPYLSGMVASHCQATKGGALYAVGGGIADPATKIVRSTIYANSANVGGGGIWTANGLLYVQNSVINGNTAGGSGGGIYNTNDLIVAATTIAYNNSAASGGGIFDEGVGGGLFGPSGLTDLTDVVLDHNVAANDGGGMHSGDAKVRTSLISNNMAGNSAGGGGLSFVGNYAIVTGSSVVANVADGDYFLTGGGGIKAVVSGLLPTVSVINSTISGNRARQSVGLLVETGGGGYFNLYNSTVAFNTGKLGSAGVGVISCTINLKSSIIARNTNAAGVYASDFAVYNCGAAPSLTGSNNLIMASIEVPAGTLSTDPHLAPLALHGGTLPTHALIANSVAVDRGANPLGLAEDERGSGHARTVGATTDIGAYERQSDDDELFYDGFE